MFTLDLNGKIQETYVNGWYDGMAAHRYGWLGFWGMVNCNPMTRMAVIADRLKYQGDGTDYHWAILWS